MRIVTQQRPILVVVCGTTRDFYVLVFICVLIPDVAVLTSLSFNLLSNLNSQSERETRFFLCPPRLPTLSSDLVVYRKTQSSDKLLHIYATGDELSRDISCCWRPRLDLPAPSAGRLLIRPRMRVPIHTVSRYLDQQL